MDFFENLRNEYTKPYWKKIFGYVPNFAYF